MGTFRVELAIGQAFALFAYLKVILLHLQMFSNRFLLFSYYSILLNSMGAYVCYRLMNEHADAQYCTW